MENEFLGNPNFQIKNQTVSSSCPSNIALIKYWGKYDNQIPANPSISYTLNHCKTNTVIEFFANEEFSVQTFLAGNEEVKFAEKIEKYFRNIEVYLPWILKGKFIIKTENTFPHSSGIASSASGFGAIAKCLMALDSRFVGNDSETDLQVAETDLQVAEMDMQAAKMDVQPSEINKQATETDLQAAEMNMQVRRSISAEASTTTDNRQPTTDNQQPTTKNEQKASFLARLGSGSACRSLYNGLVVWGETPEVEGSSDLFAVKYPDAEIHPIFKNFNDWVLLIHEGQKSVSSTVGHGLMNTNPYAERRFQEARENFVPMKEILKSGDLQKFITLVEHEALTLHAMMMMSEPAFILMKTGTLEVINKIWKFREETGLPLFFTLDAGANVHLLFPDESKEQRAKSKEIIEKFIETELLQHTQNGGVVKDFMKW